MTRKRPALASVRDGEAETPLHGVAWRGDLLAAKKLIAGGADVNQTDSVGETPLHGAAAWGRAPMVKLLLSSGARHDIPGTMGTTPLHWAAGWGNLQTVKVLVAAGADLAARNKFGRTPAQVARQYGRATAVKFLEKSQLTTRLRATRRKRRASKRTLGDSDMARVPAPEQVSALSHRWGRLSEIATAYKTFLNREVLVGPKRSCPSDSFVAQTTHTLLVIYYSFLYSLFDSSGVNFIKATEGLRAGFPPEAWEARDKAISHWQSFGEQMARVRHKIGFHGEDNYQGLEVGYEQYRNIDPHPPELLMMYLAAFFRFVHLRYEVAGPMVNAPTEDGAREMLNAAREAESEFASFRRSILGEVVDDVARTIQLTIIKQRRKKGRRSH